MSDCPQSPLLARSRPGILLTSKQRLLTRQTPDLISHIHGKSLDFSSQLSDGYSSSRVRICIDVLTVETSHPEW